MRSFHIKIRISGFFWKVGRFGSPGYPLPPLGWGQAAISAFALAVGPPDSRCPVILTCKQSVTSHLLLRLRLYFSKKVRDFLNPCFSPRWEKHTPRPWSGNEFCAFVHRKEAQGGREMRLDRWVGARSFRVLGGTWVLFWAWWETIGALAGLKEGGLMYFIERSLWLWIIINVRKKNKKDRGVGSDEEGL